MTVRPHLYAGRGDGPPHAARLGAVFRFISTFRLVHAYGVFPPHASPPVRLGDGALPFRTVISGPCMGSPYKQKWGES
jgi:hypothetical protein